MLRKYRKHCQHSKLSSNIHVLPGLKDLFYGKLIKFYLQSEILFKLSPECREQAKCLKILHNFTDKVISERKAIREEKSQTESIDTNKKKKPQAFLDLLLEASDNGAKLSDSDIREEVDTFMAAGHDTTTAAISWTFFLLGCNQDIQKKYMKNWILYLVKIYHYSDDKYKHATIDDLKRMKYLECVIKESQRLFPSVPIMARKVTPTDTLTIDGKTVPPGVSVNITPYLLHRDPVAFPNPEKFDPSRFFPENSLNRNPFAYIPFSAGPRNCIGKKFAMLELKVVLSRVLRSFIIKSLDSQDKIKFTIEIVLNPKNGINVSLTPRNLKKFAELVNKFPGPSGWPIIGNALDLMIKPEDLMPLLQTYYKTWPMNFRLWVGNEPMLFVCNAKDTEAVCSSSTLIDKSSLYDYIHPWLGRGLLTSTGKKWQTRRKLLTPSFHFRILDAFIPVFNNHSDTLIEILTQNAKKSSIDIYFFVTLCTLDVICESVMGVEVNALINHQSPAPYVVALERLKDIVHCRMFKIYLQSELLFKLLPEGRDHDKCLKIMHEFTEKVISDKKTIRQEKSENESSIDTNEKKKLRPFLDLLLETSDNGKNLSDSDIREEVDTFMFEGHDTTAVGISWTFYLLGRNQDVQKKVQEELDSIFGDDTTKQATLEDLKRMKYLECVIKESQRIFPSVPIIARQVTTDMIMIDGKTIPPGVSVNITPYLLHRDPVVFPNPEKFDPSRFFPENSLNRSPFAYIPFSAGPRNCIGQKFAMFELKVVLSRVLRSFIIESLEPQDKIKFTVEIVTKPKDGINVRLTPRNLKKIVELVNKFPGPAAWPIIGNALELMIPPEDFMPLLCTYYKEWPKYFRVWVGNIPLLFLCNAKEIEAVCSSSTLIDKSSSYDYLHPWLGRGLLTSTGKKWQTRRKLLTPSFHFRILDGFIPVFNDHSNTLIEILTQNVKKTSIDIHFFVTLCTLDIICG
uniref:Cytochrome P450 n=1 Tax=Strigamia maritima TaxID=126957 RepID=T1J5A8_STRMM